MEQNLRKPIQNRLVVVIGSIDLLNVTANKHIKSILPRWIEFSFQEAVARGYRLPLPPRRRLSAEGKERVTELRGTFQRGRCACAWMEQPSYTYISDVFSSFFWRFDAPSEEDKEMLRLWLSDSLTCHLCPLLYSEKDKKFVMIRRIVCLWKYIQVESLTVNGSKCIFSWQKHRTEDLVLFE